MAHTKRKNLRRPQPKRFVKLEDGYLLSRYGVGCRAHGIATYSFVGGLCGNVSLTPCPATLATFKCRQTGDFITAPYKVAA